MAKKYTFGLTAEETADLEHLVQRRVARSIQLVRAQCLLAMATTGRAWTDAQTATTYGVSTRSLERLRQRVSEAGVAAALAGQPRQHWPESKFTGAVEAHLIATSCSAPPVGSARWTLQLLAAHLVTAQVLPAISPASVGRVLKKTSSNRGNGRCG